MSYRTSLPLHPTEDDKPKKQKRLKKRIGKTQKKLGKLKGKLVIPKEEALEKIRKKMSRDKMSKSAAKPRGTKRRKYTEKEQWRDEDKRDIIRNREYLGSR